MAIIKMSPPKQSRPSGLGFLIRYMIDDRKTDPALVSGVGCNPETAYEEMLLTKEQWNKTDGRQYCHFIQSFSPGDRVTPELAHQIGLELLREHPAFQGFEVVLATHVNRSHLHNHFALNSVNAETGRKWQQKAQDLYRLKEASNRLCGRHALSQIPLEGSRRSRSYGEWKHRSAGTSWKAVLEADVRDCLSHCQSREAFIHAMSAKGYGVTWTKERKQVTFTTPDGRKCRGAKLSDPDYFSKEQMQEQLDNNRADLSLLDTDPNLFVAAMGLASSAHYPDQPNELANASAHRDLSHLEYRELLIAIRQLCTEEELRKTRRMNQQTARENAQRFARSLGALADLFQEWLEDEEIEL